MFTNETQGPKSVAKLIINVSCMSAFAKMHWGNMLDFARRLLWRVCPTQGYAKLFRLTAGSIGKKHDFVSKVRSVENLAQKQEHSSIL